MTIPTPKYEIGQKVFVARHKLTLKAVQCPDCLGSGEWPVTTPAGESFTILCGTCSQFSYGIPCGSTRERSFEAWAEQLTIGSVRLDTAERERSPISYMCEETGVGSGTIWHEDQVFSDEESARKLAHFLGSDLLTNTNKIEGEREEKERKRAQRKPSWEKRRIRELEDRVKELTRLAAPPPAAEPPETKR